MLITSVMIMCNQCGTANWLSRYKDDTVCNVCGHKLRGYDVQSTNYGLVVQKGTIDND